MTRTVKIILCALAVLIAAGVTLYPLLSNRYAEKTKSLIETQYTEAIQQLDESELIAAREAAHEYNTTLVNVTDKAFSKEALIRASESYDTLLNIRGDGLMGYVEIPKISVNLPIYHGTGEDSLGRGIGHLLGSSLPVGGSATHCILTGHSGLAREKMFSDLDQLEKGDIFFLHVLNETLAYMVQDMYTVLPEDTSHLMIEGQHDYCTLITCTPFGVNTHRLLIRGERVEYTAATELVESAEYTDVPEAVPSTWTDAYLRGLLYGLLAVSGIGGGLLLYKRCHKPRRRRRHRARHYAPIRWPWRRKRGKHEAR